MDQIKLKAICHAYEVIIAISLKKGKRTRVRRADYFSYPFQIRRTVTDNRP